MQPFESLIPKQAAWKLAILGVMVLVLLASAGCRSDPPPNVSPPPVQPEQTPQAEVESCDPWDNGLEVAGSDDPEEALRRSDCLVEKYPKNPSSYYYRGRDRYRLGQLEFALTDFDRVIELQPTHADAYLMRGLTARSLGDLAQAIADFNQVISLNRGYLEAYYYRGLTKMQLGLFPLGLADFRRIIETNGRHVEAHFQAGIASYKMGNFLAASDSFARVLELDPSHDRALSYRNLIVSAGRMPPNRGPQPPQRGPSGPPLGNPDLSQALEDALRLRREGRWTDARSRLDYVIQEDPANAFALFLRSMIFEHLKEYERAITDLNTLEAILPQGDVDIFYRRAIANLALGREALAIGDLNRVIKRYDDNAALDGTTFEFSNYLWSAKESQEPVGPGFNYFTGHNAHVDDKGHLHLRIDKVSGEWQGAEVIANRPLGYGKYSFKLKELPDLTMNHVVLGFFTYDDTAPDEAFREIDIEFRGRPNGSQPYIGEFTVQPYLEPGHIYRFGGDPGVWFSFDWHPDRIFFKSQDANGETIQSWEFSGEGIPAPGKERIRLNLWLVNGKPPEKQQPIEVVIEGFDFQPHKPDPLGRAPWEIYTRSKYFDALYHRALVRRNAGQLDSALSDLSSILNLDYRHADAYLLRGTIRTWKGQLDLAFKDFDQAITQVPDYVDAYILRGLAYRNSGQLELAHKDFDRAIFLDPRSGEAYLFRGTNRAWRGDRASAAEDFAKVIELDPNHVDAYVQRGLNYLRSGELPLALKDFKQVISLDPEHSDARRFLKYINDQLAGSTG